MHVVGTISIFLNRLILSEKWSTHVSESIDVNLPGVSLGSQGSTSIVVSSACITLPVRLFSETEESSFWISISNPFTAISDVSEIVDYLVCLHSTFSMSLDLDVPFSP
jgi:hypothetical protein